MLVRLPGLGPGGGPDQRRVTKAVGLSRRHGLAQFGFGDESSAVRLPGLGPGGTWARPRSTAGHSKSQAVTPAWFGTFLVSVTNRGLSGCQGLAQAGGVA